MPDQHAVTINGGHKVSPCGGLSKRERYSVDSSGRVLIMVDIINNPPLAALMSTVLHGRPGRWKLSGRMP
jgi:hypothetical protein